MRHFEIEKVRFEDRVFSPIYTNKRFLTIKSALRWIRKNPDAGTFRINYITKPSMVDGWAPVHREVLYTFYIDSGLWVAPNQKRALNPHTGKTQWVEPSSITSLRDLH